MVGVKQIFTVMPHKHFMDSPAPHHGSRHGDHSHFGLGAPPRVQPELEYRDHELLRGIAAGQLQLAFQPKLNVRSGVIDAAEALVRWDHPAMGLVMPDRFIDRSEDTGTIAELTVWTFQQSARDQQEFARLGLDLRIYVNLSAGLLTQETTVAELCAVAAQPGVKLGLEVTERSVIDDPQLAFANIARLRAAGYAIAIDDYGSGLSSLTYLKQIDADELKIDKSFILSLATSHRDPLIVRSTIDLAHALGLKVTAEGVETQAAHALLTVMGCDSVQGFLTGRPMPKARFLEHLAKFTLSSITFAHDITALTNHKIWKRA
ncbi:MAG: EAL domain-containing protein [Pseudomonadota bacterium]